MWTFSKNSTQLALAYAQLESVVLQRTAQLQILSQRLLKVQDEERRKLSRDLHDSTGQTLTALKIGISMLQEQCKQNPSTMVLASEVTVLADQAIEEIRTMSYLLHPPLLDEVGFACAAEWYAEGFAKRTGVTVKLDIATAPERLPIGIEIALFRVLQESLTNVHRHSGASEVSVCFLRQLENIVLEIRDDGCGIPAKRLDRLREASAETGVGLAGMRERMNELNGKLEIESDRQGTTMRAIVPRSTITQSGLLGGQWEGTASPIPKDGASTADPENKHSIRPSGEVTTSKAWESPRPQQPDGLATMHMQRATRVAWQKRPWVVDLAAAFCLLVLTCWVAYRDGHAPSYVGSLELQGMTGIQQQISRPRANVVPAEDKSKFQAGPIPGREARTATLPRVELAEQRVVHIGEDVTVRYFTPKPVSHLVPVAQYQVVHMGEDVTVRYFTRVGRATTN